MQSEKQECPMYRKIEWRHGCAPEMSVQENLIVSNIDTFTNKLGMIQTGKVKEHCAQQIEEFTIKTKDENQSIGSLSGGNIQKAIVAREFKAKSDLLVLNQPTRGVDVESNFLYPLQDSGDEKA